MQTSQKQTFLFNDSLRQSHHSKKQICMECSFAFQVRGIYFPLGSSVLTWPSLLRDTAGGKDRLQVRLAARETVQQVTCCAESRASKPLVALFSTQQKIPGFQKWWNIRNFSNLPHTFKIEVRKWVWKYCIYNQTLFLILRNALTEIFRKTHEKDEATLYWKQLEIIMAKKKRNWKLKKLDALEATWDRWVYLQFDHYHLLLFESSKVTSTPQTLTSCKGSFTNDSHLILEVWSTSKGRKFPSKYKRLIKHSISFFSL